MKKQEKEVSKTHNGLGDMSPLTRQSFDAMSSAFSGWMRHANRFQSEAIGFINDRFIKDIDMMSRFAMCKKPEELFALQAKLANDLVADYVAEGTKLLELLGEVAKEKTEEPSGALHAKH